MICKQENVLFLMLFLLFLNRCFNVKADLEMVEKLEISLLLCHDNTFVSGEVSDLISDRECLVN